MPCPFMTLQPAPGCFGQYIGIIYQFLVLDNATQPQAAYDFGLDPNNVIDYDFEDATKNIGTYVQEVMEALANAGVDTGENRFKTS